MNHYFFFFNKYLTRDTAWRASVVFISHSLSNSRRGGLLYRYDAEEVASQIPGERGRRLSHHSNDEEPAGGSGLRKNSQTFPLPHSHSRQQEICRWVSFLFFWGGIQRPQAVSDDVSPGELQGPCWGADETATSGDAQDDGGTGRRHRRVRRRHQPERSWGKSSEFTKSPRVAHRVWNVTALCPRPRWPRWVSRPVCVTYGSDSGSRNTVATRGTPKPTATRPLVTSAAAALTGSTSAQLPRTASRAWRLITWP